MVAEVGRECVLRARKREVGAKKCVGGGDFCFPFNSASDFLISVWSN